MLAACFSAVATKFNSLLPSSSSLLLQLSGSVQCLVSNTAKVSKAFSTSLHRRKSVCSKSFHTKYRAIIEQNNKTKDHSISNFHNTLTEAQHKKHRTSKRPPKNNPQASNRPQKTTNDQIYHHHKDSKEQTTKSQAQRKKKREKRQKNDNPTTNQQETTDRRQPPPM